ncbi:uncharacterized protein LOC120085955 isoform X2 [Benincasa hispida]|uniref:uncharacterized protein LOC120085955 isoform X2 n=1 Tax=Benincasa hispida TaxID=102211 RepID=UPI0019025ECC|nr:uncharacterized protein LOC120085955 isoform X2 [Benincasa hispida]
MATSESKPHDQLIPLPESESQLSALIFDISQQAQGAMESMLRMISEIDQNAVGIVEDIEKCRGSALDRKGVLEEEKQQFQQAAYTVLDMLNNGEGTLKAVINLGRKFS